MNNNWLTVHNQALAEALGAPLPADCAPTKIYAGPARLIVPTVRSSVGEGEALTLTIIALFAESAKTVAVKVRPLGGGDWNTVEAKHIGRAVWNATLPAAGDDFEYQVVAKSATGATLVWPATAPQLNQTVIVTP